MPNFPSYQAGYFLTHRGDVRIFDEIDEVYVEKTVWLIITRLSLQMNGGRQLSGILRDYDPFMNLVLDEGVEKKKTWEQQQVILVAFTSGVNQVWEKNFEALVFDHWQVVMVVIRGNSIIMLEAMERI
jgi:small nuclear ribonucleoprotein G